MSRDDIYNNDETNVCRQSSYTFSRQDESAFEAQQQVLEEKFNNLKQSEMEPFQHVRDAIDVDSIQSIDGMDKLPVKSVHHEATHTTTVYGNVSDELTITQRGLLCGAITLATLCCYQGYNQEVFAAILISGASMFYYKITEKQQQNSHSAGSNLFAAGHAVQTQTVNTATNNDSDVESLFSNR